MNLKRKTSNLVVKWSNQCIVHPHALCNSIPGLTRTKRTQLWFSRVFEVLKFVSCLWTGFRSRVQCHPVETICKDLASRFTERDTMGPKPGGYLQISANGPIVHPMLPQKDLKQPSRSVWHFEPDNQCTPVALCPLKLSTWSCSLKLSSLGASVASARSRSDISEAQVSRVSQLRTTFSVQGATWASKSAQPQHPQALNHALELHTKVAPECRTTHRGAQVRGRPLPQNDSWG